jgi:hypothetical protein
MSRELSQAIATDRLPFLGKEEYMALGTLTLTLGNVAFVASVGGGDDGVDLTEIVYRLSKTRPTAPQSEDSMGVGADPFFFTDEAPGPFSLIRRASAFVWADCRNYGNFTLCGGAAPWDFDGPPIPNPDWPETSDNERTAVLAENITSLSFRFFDRQGNETLYTIAGSDKPFWNSTAAVAWQNELSDPGDSGVPPAASVIGPAVPADMLNRAPAQVVITMHVLDAKAATRYKASGDANAQKRIYLESRREFTTSVSIPNRQP